MAVTSKRQAIALPDLRFNDEQMNRLMQFLRTLTQEVNAIQSGVRGGETGQVLTKLSAQDFDAQWRDP